MVRPPGIDLRQVESARAVAQRLVQLLDPLDRSRPWAAQVEWLYQLANALGLGEPGDPALEALWDALDDQADVRDRLGRGKEELSWAEFAAAVDSIILDASIPPPPAIPGSIRFATVDQAQGARGEYVILAGLVEGAFPVRAAVEPFLRLGSRDEPDNASRLGYAQEMLRFLRVLGSADRGVILVYPTTDLKGHELLRAGFLDDLLALLAPQAAGTIHQAYPRLEPGLLDQPDLAGAPPDIRVRAVALASERGQTAELERLARDSEHRPVLDGAAAALFAQRHRLRGTPFSEFEGMLKEGATILDLQSFLDASKGFSPSQLETYIGCPFKFLIKYVLKLEPVEEREELDEDFTERGSLLHDILEKFENKLKEESHAEDLRGVGEILVGEVLDEKKAEWTDRGQGLLEVERRRLNRTILHYIRQREAYASAEDVSFAPHGLELAFGDTKSDHPVLELVQGSRSIKLRGKIDRIDVAETVDGLRFRVIDYKSGSVPTTSEVKQGSMLQLPLYAMAVQRLILAEEQAGLFDLGYWSLRKDGFKSIVFDNWDEDQSILEAYVLDLVDELRRGVFAVDSQDPGCESFCEYREVCRVRQVRQAGKTLERQSPTLSVKAQRARKVGGNSGKTKSAEPEA